MSLIKQTKIGRYELLANIFIKVLYIDTKECANDIYEYH